MQQTGNVGQSYGVLIELYVWRLHRQIFDDTLMPLELELGQMDVAGFQMLANPNATMIADPTDEDTFRQDLH